MQSGVLVGPITCVRRRTRRRVFTATLCFFPDPCASPRFPMQVSCRHPWVAGGHRPTHGWIQRELVADPQGESSSYLKLDSQHCSGFFVSCWGAAGHSTGPSAAATGSGMTSVVCCRCALHPGVQPAQRRRRYGPYPCEWQDVCHLSCIDVRTHYRADSGRTQSASQAPPMVKWRKDCSSNDHPSAQPLRYQHGGECISKTHTPYCPLFLCLQFKRHSGGVSGSDDGDGSAQHETHKQLNK